MVIFLKNENREIDFNVCIDSFMHKLKMKSETLEINNIMLQYVE